MRCPGSGLPGLGCRGISPGVGGALAAIAVGTEVCDTVAFNPGSVGAERG